MVSVPWLGPPTGGEFLLCLIFALILFRRATFWAVLAMSLLWIVLYFAESGVWLLVFLATVFSTLLVAIYIWLLYQTYFSDGKK